MKIILETQESIHIELLPNEVAAPLPDTCKIPYYTYDIQSLGDVYEYLSSQIDYYKGLHDIAICSHERLKFLVKILTLTKVTADICLNNVHL